MPLLLAAPSAAFATHSEAAAVFWMMVFVAAVTGLIFAISAQAEDDKGHPTACPGEGLLAAIRSRGWQSWLRNVSFDLAFSSG